MMELKTAELLIAGGDTRVIDRIWNALEIAGYTLRAAEDDASALKVMSEREIGLTICALARSPDSMDLLRALVSNARGTAVVAVAVEPSIEEAVDAMRCGAADYLSLSAILTGPRDLVARYGRERYAHASLGIIGSDPRTLEGLALIDRVAPTNVSVLLTGESGSGKEVYARAIHAMSPRAREAFVAVNCAAIPDNLLEATLFGHERGAYTGAHAAQAGKFELAQGGTLLLDEVTEMPLHLQAKLLRVLQERVVERVGGRTPIPLDVRVIATSNRDVRKAVDEGFLREDLYYRLAVFPVHIAALRERPADIMPLARHFLAMLAEESGRNGVQISDKACEVLQSYSWPGNVRELQNVMQRALILAPTNYVDESHLCLPCPRPHRHEDQPPVAAAHEAGDTSAVRSYTWDSVANPITGESRAVPLDMKSLERVHIMETLAAVNGSRKRAVELLGMSERTLRHKLRQYRLTGLN